jgi:LPXTG-motif cell wall-anchored protein
VLKRTISTAVENSSDPESGADVARTLPKTASSWPLLAFASLLMLAIGLTLTLRRRLVR